MIQYITLYVLTNKKSVVQLDIDNKNKGIGMNSTEKFIDGWDGISSEGDGATGRQ